MRFLDDLSYPDIAQLLGKSVGAVRVIQFRALANLRLRMDGAPAVRHKASSNGLANGNGRAKALEDGPPSGTGRLKATAYANGNGHRKSVATPRRLAS
jgi:hypothetical protein